MAKSKKKTHRGTPSQIKAARAEYGVVKKLYHKVGKAAFGKPKTSAVKKDYLAVRREYRRVGNALGRLTGIK